MINRCLFRLSPVRRAVIFGSLLSAALMDTRADDAASEMYREAVQNIDLYCDNMNDRWFAFFVTNKYHDDNNRSYTQERQGVAYYSDRLLYINAYQTFSSQALTREPREHFELIVSDQWTISIDHNRRHGPVVSVADGPTSGARRIANAVRSGNDIATRFASRIRRIVAHEFAVPRLDPHNRLVVRLDRKSYVNNPSHEKMQKYPILDVTFSGTQPLSLISFQADDLGKLKETGRTVISYTLNSAGRPILHRMISESHSETSQVDFTDFQVRETSPPDWCEQPPKITLPADPISVEFYDTRIPQTVSELPEAVSDLVLRCSSAELQTRLQQQQQYLAGVRDFVLALPAAPPESRPSETDPSAEGPASPSGVPLLVPAGVVLFLILCWIVLWLRRN
ncbi:MAG: hypothetical protein KDA89_05320 [Planctomycetaceae bacterium]|nr:hypothetical protein [Planctomycetaceae bacterium]